MTANLAAQVADPRDLAHSAAPTPPDAARKSVILDRYRQGKVTAADTDQSAKSTISTAIQ